MADVTLDAHGAASAGAQDRTASAAARDGAQDWLTAIEKSNLTPRYYATIVLIVLQEMFEFYDPGSSWSAISSRCSRPAGTSPTARVR